VFVDEHNQESAIKKEEKSLSKGDQDWDHFQSRYAEFER
jgi:hypothetical protein